MTKGRAGGRALMLVIANPSGYPADLLATMRGSGLVFIPWCERLPGNCWGLVWSSESHRWAPGEVPRGPEEHLEVGKGAQEARRVSAGGHNRILGPHKRSQEPPQSSLEAPNVFKRPQRGAIRSPRAHQKRQSHTLSALSALEGLHSHDASALSAFQSLQEVHPKRPKSGSIGPVSA